MENKVILFLGSGASATFGLPTGKMLANNVQNDLKAYSQRIEEIRNNVKTFGFEDNIDSILAVLDFWSNPRQTLIDKGPFIAEVTTHKINYFKVKIRDKRIALRIKEYIVRKCFVNDRDAISQIENIYDKFFRGLVEKYKLPLCDIVSTGICPAIDVFTTNYDNIIEEYCRVIGVLYFDGYMETVNRRYKFQHEKYKSHIDRIRLHKLHGTITYSVLENNSIASVSYIPQRGGLIIGGEKATPDLIYPGMHHYLAKDPQLEMLYTFKSILKNSDICIAIGYSFSDPQIYQIFTDACNHNPDLKIYIISENSDKLIKSKKMDSNFFIPIKKRLDNLDVTNDIEG